VPCICFAPLKTRMQAAKLTERRLRAHRIPAEPVLVWHMATRSSMSALPAAYAMTNLATCATCHKRRSHWVAQTCGRKTQKSV
jgi:hypothetical protein